MEEEMQYKEALEICKNILSNEDTFWEKGRAIKTIMDCPTQVGLTKSKMADVIRWLWDQVFEEDEEQ